MLGHIPEVLHALPPGRTAVRVFFQLTSILAPKSLSDLHHLGNRLLGDVWNRRVRGWETDRNQDEWSLVLRTAEDARKETHRARSMVRVARPLMWSAARRNPVAMPRASEENNPPVR